jgi:hypothetical protein
MRQPSSAKASAAATERSARRGAEQHRGPEVGEQHHGAVALVVVGAHVQFAGAGGGVAVDEAAVVALGPGPHVVGLGSAPPLPRDDAAGQAGDGAGRG